MWRENANLRNHDIVSKFGRATTDTCVGSCRKLQGNRECYQNHVEPDNDRLGHYGAAMTELETRLLALFDALIELSEAHGLAEHPFHAALVQLRCQAEDGGRDEPGLR